MGSGKETSDSEAQQKTDFVLITQSTPSC